MDQSDQHLDLLAQNDKRQDDIIATLETSLPNLDGKLKALELADEFFQVIKLNLSVYLNYVHTWYSDD